MPPGRQLRHHPAVGAWSSNWVATTEESTRRPSATTAAAVSSQEVSMPKISIFTGLKKMSITQRRKDAKNANIKIYCVFA